VLIHLNLGENKDQTGDAETEIVSPYTTDENSKLNRLREVISASEPKILEIAGFDAAEFKLESCRFQFWNAFCKNGLGGKQITELFSVSVSAVPRAATGT